MSITGEMFVNKRKLRYYMECLGVRILYAHFRLLPFETASWLGGSLARMAGPRLRRTAVARRNIELAMPELRPAEVRNLLNTMWENLGRTFAEFPHIASMSPAELSARVEFIGLEHISEASTRDGGNLLFTGHLANWEIAPRMFAELGFPMSIVYREGNNPGLGRLIRELRHNYLLSAIPKGASGSRQIMKALAQNGRVGMLVDQKMNDGIKTSFLGREAMTAPAIARLALRYKIPVLPVRVIRLEGARFMVIVSPPLYAEDSGNTDRDVHVFMDRVNAILESWIREYPGQWIWVHNRWSSSG